jgi:hypothetical protein
MTRVPWLLAVGFVALGAVACSGPDVPVVENGSAGEAAGGTANQAGGSPSKGSTSGGATSGASSTGGASGGTKAMGGLSGTGGAMGGSAGSGLDGTSSGCEGEPPLCFGNDAQSCCGNDPAGTATCEKGGWYCSGASAPGCNGTQCTDQFDCGTQLQCGRSTTYCAVTPTNADSADYACVAIPTECLVNGNGLCACLEKDPCTSCTESFGAVTLTCPP